MTKESKYYFCYNRELSNLLAKHGIRYITKARAVRDNEIFTLYERTEELEKLLGLDSKKSGCP